MPNKAWHHRQAIWQHNGLFGSVAMAIQAMRSIQQRSTTTDESRAYAVKIENLLGLLNASLKTRRPRNPADE